MNANMQTRCRASYKIRCFYSKGAFLTLFWTILVSMSFLYLCIVLFGTLFRGIENVKVYSTIALVPAVPFFFCTPIIGWIADTRYGNYGMNRIGAIMFLLATITACVCSLILLNVSVDSVLSKVISGGISPVMYAVAFLGVSAFAVTTVQLGLDQMPDASSENISSFLTWFVFSLIFGAWMLETGYFIFASCDTIHSLALVFSISQLFSLFPAIISSVICCSLFLLGPKWLIIEPNCPQSLKIIYQVLRFAWKHKAPVNRSALTYWEENIPSRMDLGKSRYGGPFTTEEVEDVKIFFKILVIFLPVFLSFCSFMPYVPPLNEFDSECYSIIMYCFTYSTTWVMIVALLVYEFVFYPLIGNLLPSILKRIGFLLFLVSVFNLVELIIRTSSFSWQVSPWSNLAYSVPFSCIIVFLITGLLEFVIAQSPYKMRGLLLGYTMFSCFISSSIHFILYYVCCGSHCFIIKKSVLTALSVVGFILYSLLARSYKMRVRDENYNVYKVVEEIYDRYLSQRPQ